MCRSIDLVSISSEMQIMEEKRVLPNRLWWARITVFDLEVLKNTSD